MSPKVSAGFLLLFFAVTAAVTLQAPKGFGDDNERSVLVQSPRTLTPLSGTPAEPVPLTNRAGSPVQPGVGSTRSNEPPSSFDRRQSSLINRLQEPSVDGIPRTASNDPDHVPSRRPGGFRTSERGTPESSADAAPPAEIDYSAQSSRRPTKQGVNLPSASALMRSPGPSIVLEAVGPPAILLGKPAKYRIIAVNTGSIPAQDVFVRIEAPASARIVDHEVSTGQSHVVENGDGVVRVEWEINELTARAQEQLEITLVPQNQATLPLRMEWTMRPRQSTVDIEIQEPKLDLAVVGAKSIMYGETEVYTITISNPGNGPAENVILDVATGQGPGESQRIGTIPAGGREVVKLELTAGDAGEMAIQAAVRGDGGLTKAVRHDVIVRRANLDLEIAGPGLKYAGAVAAYQIRVRNTGDAPAPQVDATLQLPSGAKYLAGLSSAESGDRTMAWRIGTLQPGDERVYKVQCELTLAGENRLTLSAQSGDLKVAKSFATRVEAVADLKLVVNDPKGPQAVGQIVEYEVLLLNRGTKSASSMNVIVHFAEGIDPVAAEGREYELGEGQVFFKAIPRIGPGQTVLLKVRARASRGGDHRFRAEVTCEEPNTRLIAEETTRYFGDEPAVSSQP